MGNDGGLTINLSGKTALVTGGSRGIGAAITEALAMAGASVTFTHTGSKQRQEAVEDLVKRLRNSGHAVEAVASDACDSAATAACVNSVVEKYGRIDILVHNVGKNLARTPEEITDTSWRKFVDINLSSAFYAVRACVPHMVSSKYGRIILIGSSAQYSGGGGAIDYAAAKSGLTGMMTYLCKAYARQGILTNIIHPCVIETDLLKNRYRDEAAKRELIAQIPAGRLGKPEDIAGLVTYLVSSWGDYICGQAILVDGGRTFFS